MKKAMVIIGKEKIIIVYLLWSPILNSVIANITTCLAVVSLSTGKYLYDWSLR